MRRWWLLCVALVLMAVPVAHAQPTSQFFDSDGVQIHYTDQGEGEPVVLIHGFGRWLDSWEQNDIAPALAKSSYRVVSLDVRGHGKSGKPHDSGSYGTKVRDDVIRLMDHLGLADAHVVGYSMGGRLVLSLLADHQDQSAPPS